MLDNCPYPLSTWTNEQLNTLASLTNFVDTPNQNETELFDEVVAELQRRGAIARAMNKDE